jgi:Leucine-rich repeat (LRR) protein
MRSVPLALMFAVGALCGGCHATPTGAPRPASTSPPSALSQKTSSQTPPLTPKTKQDLALEAIKKRGGFVRVDPSELQKPAVYADLHGFRNAVAALDSLAPLTKLRELNLHGAGFTDADLEHLRGLPELATLNLSATKITDSGLAILQTLPNLSALNLNETDITDGGLKHLRGLSHLSDLSLYGTKVSDEGVAQLQGMQTLQKLVIGGSKSITDRSVTTLATMHQLHDVIILSSRVTKSALEDLKNSSPQLKIIP